MHLCVYSLFLQVPTATLPKVCTVIVLHLYQVFLNVAVLGGNFEFLFFFVYCNVM